MSYQVLARKWRPQSFTELIGQQPIVTALKNALAEGRIAQAYVFSGIRGVGKTTAARLLAKALNCERGPVEGPCNQCASCREITAGADLDVLEVDAATYSKVEQVRDLTESLRYGPSRDRYKVVVLDEVHRLSRQAFDALLKIVEEPPPRLVFIFATTEIEAVPATILSRCQEYHFRRVSAPVVAAHLREIAIAETITASDAALRLIARAGEGSVRDAVALLDQLATFGGGTVEEQDAARLLGGLDTALFATLFDGLIAGRGGDVVAAIRRVEDEGWDPRHVYAHFLGYLRHALHFALGGDSAEMELVDLGAEEAHELARRARAAGYENILRLLHLLLANETAVRKSELAGLAVEIAWLRAAELPKLVLVEEMLAGGTGAGPAVMPPRPAPVAPPAAAPMRPMVTAPAPAPDASSVAEAPPKPDLTAAPRPQPVPTPAAKRPEAAPEAPAAETAAGTVAAFQEALARRRQPLAAYLGHAVDLDWTEGELRISMPAGDNSLAEALARGGNGKAFDEVLAETFGAGSRYRLVHRAPVAAPVISAPDDAPALAAAAANPTVQRVLDIFGGTVQRIELETEEEG